ncbi:DUF6192 family protein [Streptomyces sp. NPDC050988]|uniref:DUF6192 family protein n=1 Tax=Streptomyces sp. NPDC050988 TaxID=3365637 RepID=UPI00378FE1AC
MAKKSVGWKTEAIQVPVTAQEKGEAIHELARDDEAVAAQVATDFLRRPEEAFKAMRDAEARENVNEAQFEQAGLDDDQFDEEYEEAFAEEGEPFDDPAHIVHSWRKSMEFNDLIAVCQGFIAGAARLVPRLRGHEFTDTQTKALENHLEKIRATTDWIQDGFAVLAKRWRVERAISWIMRARRNVRDYERLISHSETHIIWTFITLMTRRLTRPPRPPRSAPHPVKPAAMDNKPRPIRLRTRQPRTIRLAPAALSWPRRPHGITPSLQYAILLREC